MPQPAFWTLDPSSGPRDERRLGNAHEGDAVHEHVRVLSAPRRRETSSTPWKCAADRFSAAGPDALPFTDPRYSSTPSTVQVVLVHPLEHGTLDRDQFRIRNGLWIEV